MLKLEVHDATLGRRHGLKRDDVARGAHLVRDAVGELDQALLAPALVALDVDGEDVIAS